MDQNRHRDASMDDLARLDEQQALQHRLERLGARAPRWPGKDDRRSSERLTASERNERWPIG
jgi:hypothetical protein